MKKKLLSLGLIAVLLTGSLTGCGSNKNSVRMINVSYDPTRELFESYNEIFAQHWKEQTGQDGEVIQSHGGSGKQALEEVWPNLEVFFHGGVAFTPYREQYKQVITTPKMHYVETYNASEGYFGTQNDLSDPAMLLMIDYGIFYEFVPLEEVGKENPRAYCLEEVELNKNYAMVISTSCGLWRYMIGDTVKFTSKNPYKFVITGRTKHFINAFGEELIVDNAEKGLAKACAETGAQICEYSAAPVFMDENAKCRHQWLIEFAKMPDSVEKFASILDATLKEVNSDYEAKRWKDIALQPLEVIVARQGLFHDWLAQKGKLGGQHKVPRLSNTREYIEAMLVLNNSAHPEE